MPYKIVFDPIFEEYYLKLDNSVRKRLVKRLVILKKENTFRKLKFGLPHYVLELGQYRVIFTEKLKEKIRILIFVGNHKDYEKWLGLKK